MNSAGLERHLFIGGCPRSGTSALVFLLNEHPQLALGFERFKRVRAQLDPFHFTPSQFFSPVTAETDIRGELLYDRLRRRWERGTVRVVGDKVPLYTRVLPQLLARFPEARVVVLVREPLAVATSFERRARDPDDWWPAENGRELALEMWNEALAAVRALNGRNDSERVFLLPYEPLFAGDERWLQALLGFVDLPDTARLAAEHRRLAEGWSLRPAVSVPDAELVEYVQAQADQQLWAWARERMGHQLEQARPALDSSGLDLDQPPLSATELGEREREREQLLEEMRRPGERHSGELEVLERRLVEQSAELARRGERPRSPGGARKPRVSFIVPHQRATTGGVYVIEQLARHLTPAVDVCLAVREPPLRPVPGVEVRAVERFSADSLPPADVLVYPADMRDAALLFELPVRLGRPVMLFQGYGTPGSPVVAANLARAEQAVAIAHWLVEEALRHDTPCAYVPQGLDRGVFAPGPTQTERAPRLTLMTHRLDWKGLSDALSAVAIVRSVRADVEVGLFGTEPVAGVGEFLASPSRREVAALLQTSAVHIVSSWEEGFGLTGAEAIACGAALATTDTKGSRDYALDGHTALVSPPRDPEALARNVLELLDDVEQRTRLVATGQRQLRGVMPPWPEVARRMAFTLFER